MKFKSGGSEFIVFSYSLRESFDMEYSILRLKTPIAIYGIITVECNGKSFDMAVQNLQYQGGCYEVTAIPTIIAEKNQAVLPAFKEDADKTFKQIMQYYGIPVAYREDTQPQYWEFPEMKILEFLQRLRFIINSGSSPVFTVTAPSTLLMIDLENSLSLDAETGDNSDPAVMTWKVEPELRVPQDIELITQLVTEPDKTSTVKSKKEHGATKIVSFVTNEKLAYLPELRIQNMQGVQRFTSYTMKLVSNINRSPALGSIFSLKGQKFVVIETEITHQQQVITVARNAY